MDVNVEDRDGKIVLSPSERNHTLMNLLKQAVWESGGKSGYNQGHPYEGDTGELVVESDSPGDTVLDAVETVRDELEEFRQAFGEA